MNAVSIGIGLAAAASPSQSQTLRMGEAMKSIKKVVSAASLAVGLAVASSANAALIVDQGPLGANIAVGSPFIFTHDFTDNSTPNAYTTGVDAITAATLDIVLTDSVGNESFTISFGIAPQSSGTLTQVPNNQNATYSFALAGLSLSNLSSTGTLGVTISALSCRENQCEPNAFQFVSSTLTADVTRGTPTPRAPVTNGAPEPGTLALLGLGLAGLAATRRRKQ